MSHPSVWRLRGIVLSHPTHTQPCTACHLAVSLSPNHTPDPALYSSSFSSFSQSHSHPVLYSSSFSSFSQSHSHPALYSSSFSSFCQSQSHQALYSSSFSSFSQSHSHPVLYSSSFSSFSQSHANFLWVTEPTVFENAAHCSITCCFHRQNADTPSPLSFEACSLG